MSSPRASKDRASQTSSILALSDARGYFCLLDNVGRFHELTPVRSQTTGHGSKRPGSRGDITLLLDVGVQPLMVEEEGGVGRVREWAVKRQGTRGSPQVRGLRVPWLGGHALESRMVR